MSSLNPTRLGKSILVIGFPSTSLPSLLQEQDSHVLFFLHLESGINSSCCSLLSLYVHTSADLLLEARRVDPCTMFPEWGSITDTLSLEFDPGAGKAHTVVIPGWGENFHLCMERGSNRSLQNLSCH